MWFKKQTELTPRDKAEVEELVSYAEMTADHGLNHSISTALEKAMTSAEHFQFMAGEEGGNYFGSEFNIRATASRIKSLYGREPWIFATASLIARTLSSVPFAVVNAATDEPDESHALNEKLCTASRIEDATSMKWAGYLDLILGGNYIQAFDENFQESIKIPVESVEIDLAEDFMSVKGFWVFNQESGKRTYIPARQCVHHKFPNPYSPFWGLSLFAAASRPILMDRLKNEFEFAFYLRGGMSSGVIETTEDINKTRMKRLLRTFEATYTGKRNWWRQIFLPKGAKWVSTGFNFEQLGHFEGLRENRLALLAVLGVPPSKVGLVQDVNRSTSETQDKDLYTNTIKPLAEFIAAGWNNSYLVRVIYQGKVKVVPDFSEVEALQGSLEVKGAQAKAIEPYFWIDEIRQRIFKEEPLPNKAGARFAAEVRPALTGAPLALAAPVTELLPAPPLQLEAPPILSFKKEASDSQARIEKTLASQFTAGYVKYLDAFFAVVKGVVRSAESTEILGERLREALNIAQKDLSENYWANTGAVYERALDRGFSFANANAKTLSILTSTKVSKKLTTKTLKSGRIVSSVLKSKFDETDQQAIDALRDESASGQRATLRQRGIDHFLGMNNSRSNEVLDIIADNVAAGGMTLEAIAEQIRNVHSDRYGDQSFTIARTEVLTAVSQGIKWNHDILAEVFSDLQKQWFHIGDAGSNPNARDHHAGFESEGPQELGYRWGGVLEYPRDPGGGAKETINCRCTMVSVIPDDAESNADIILERL